MYSPAVVSYSPKKFASFVTRTTRESTTSTATAAATTTASTAAATTSTSITATAGPTYHWASAGKPTRHCTTKRSFLTKRLQGNDEQIFNVPFLTSFSLFSSFLQTFKSR